jgi:hypothetical protein
MKKCQGFSPVFGEDQIILLFEEESKGLPWTYLIVRNQDARSLRHNLLLVKLRQFLPSLGLKAPFFPCGIYGREKKKRPRIPIRFFIPLDVAEVKEDPIHPHSAGQKVL